MISGYGWCAGMTDLHSVGAGDRVDVGNAIPECKGVDVDGAG